MSDEGNIYIHIQGREVGPFAHRHTAIAWLELRGFTLTQGDRMIRTHALTQRALLAPKDSAPTPHGETPDG